MNRSARTHSELHLRYDLKAVVAEARKDFSPDTGTRRLLKQSEIAARFRKLPRAGRTAK